MAAPHRIVLGLIAALFAAPPAQSAPPPNATDAAGRNIRDIFERAAPGPARRAIGAVFGDAQASGRSVAVIIGISDYDGRRFRPLEASLRDALHMREYLIDEAGFDFVVTLTNAEATKTAIQHFMVDVAPAQLDRKSRDGRFLFYFSGHGTQDRTPTRTIGYLPLLGAEGAFSKMIGMDELELWWRKIDFARQSLFLLDSCFSGLAGVVGKSTAREVALEDLRKRGHHIFTAGSADQESFASLSQWNGSLFTRAVLDGLRGEADYSTARLPADGVVSLSELKTYVRARIQNERARRGNRFEQLPQESDLLGGASQGEFFFLTPAKVQAVAAPQAALPTGPVQGKGTASGMDAETAAWLAIAHETDPRYFRAFLKAFPNGRFASIARLKIGADTPSSAQAPAAMPPPLQVERLPAPKAAEPAPRPTAETAGTFLSRLFGTDVKPPPAPQGASWERLFQAPGRNVFNGVAVMPDGRSVLAGQTERDNGRYGWLAVLGGEGASLDDRTLEGTSGLNEVASLQSGAFALAGYLALDRFASIAVMRRLSADGQDGSSHVGSGNKSFHSIASAPDDGIFAGGSSDELHRGSDGLVVRFGGRGRTIWQRSLGGAKHDEIRAVRGLPDGGAIAAGLTYSTGEGEADGWLVRLAADGKVVWQKTYGGDRADQFNDVALAADGGFIAVGTTASRSFNDNDVWAVRVDARGQAVWDETFGNTSYDEARAVIAGPDGGWVLAGWTKSRDTGSDDGWIIGLDARGRRQWDESHGGVDHDRFHAIAAAPDGGYVAVGAAIRASARGWDGWVVKLDSAGRMTGDSAAAGPPVSRR